MEALHNMKNATLIFVVGICSILLQGFWYQYVYRLNNVKYRKVTLTESLECLGYVKLPEHNTTVSEVFLTKQSINYNKKSTF